MVAATISTTVENSQEKPARNLALPGKSCQLKYFSFHYRSRVLLSFSILIIKDQLHDIPVVLQPRPLLPPPPTSSSPSSSIFLLLLRPHIFRLRLLCVLPCICLYLPFASFSFHSCPVPCFGSACPGNRNLYTSPHTHRAPLPFDLQTQHSCLQ